MAFYEGFYNVTLLLPKKDRARLRSAMLELYFEGVEPEGLNDAQALAFSTVAERIRKARQMSVQKSGQMSGPLSVPMSGQESEQMSVQKSGQRSAQSESESMSRSEEKEKAPKGAKEKGRRKTFAKPTLEEVAAYVAEKGYHFSPAAFIAHYESNGWMVGRSPMRSWRSACATWEHNGFCGGRSKRQVGGGERDRYSTL